MALSPHHQPTDNWANSTVMRVQKTNRHIKMMHPGSMKQPIKFILFVR